LATLRMARAACTKPQARALPRQSQAPKRKEQKLAQAVTSAQAQGTSMYQMQARSRHKLARHKQLEMAPRHKRGHNSGREPARTSINVMEA